jgi:hypothetical protein
VRRISLKSAAAGAAILAVAASLLAGIPRKDAAVNGGRSNPAPARADFWVGNAGDFRVLAGSPENRGPVEFTLQALPADELRRLESGEYARGYQAQLAQRAKREKTTAGKGGK